MFKIIVAVTEELNMSPDPRLNKVHLMVKQASNCKYFLKFASPVGQLEEKNQQKKKIYWSYLPVNWIKVNYQLSVPDVNY
jgi:hypothetical protein